MDAEISKAGGPAALKREEGSRDGVSRIAQKLSSMSEADLATAMASVEGFRALLDSLHGGDVPAVDGTRVERRANTEMAPNPPSADHASTLGGSGAAKS